MILRKPLNGKHPHTLADSCRNAFDWWEGPKERDYLLPTIYTRNSWLDRLLRFFGILK